MMHTVYIMTCSVLLFGLQKSLRFDIESLTA